MLRLDNGESGQLTTPLTTQTLAYIGAANEATSSPTYSSNKIVVNGNSLTTAIGAIDAAAALLSANENVTGIWTFSNGAIVAATKKLFFSAVTDTYLYESSVGVLRAVADGTTAWVASSSAFTVGSSVDLVVAAGRKVALAGGNTTYISRYNSNTVGIFVNIVTGKQIGRAHV